jgi:threonine dehydrogenase-like Zn-dependent dehydrogenase
MMYRHEDYLYAVDMIASGKIITKPIITCNFPFDQYLKAYKFIEKQQDKCMKVIIDL